MEIYRLTPDVELRSEISVKKSRFIAVVRRVESVAAARDFVAEMRQEFPDARHHCSAYRISMRGAQDITNSSDDGEPSGTAGKPILEVINTRRLTDTAIVVVRYFGGTLLGTGGLVRAYTEAPTQALHGAQIWKEQIFQQLEVSLPLEAAGRIEAGLRRSKYEITALDYQSEKVVITFLADDCSEAAAYLGELRGAEIEVKFQKMAYREVSAGVIS
ncbi:YigZ family protein [uncultured Arcanobacterium sp.]|uniref:YigZ family protein n=1 Tax=uncultured Arcanobacterium sp. TaxID=487520 RepID=UPI0026375340|nr:YigZ family protein [uncultured Arcanobacterium sp.]